MTVDLQQLIILFGSESGTSEEQALTIHKSLTSCFPTQAECYELDKFVPLHKSQPHSNEFNKLIVIITSSTGDGEPPENAVEFNDYITLKLKNGDKCFEGYYLAVLGNGDTCYEDTFGQFPKFCYDSLKQLGAIPIIDLKITDLEEGVELVYEPWLNEFYDRLAKLVDGKIKFMDGVEVEVEQVEEMEFEVKKEIVEVFENGDQVVVEQEINVKVQVQESQVQANSVNLTHQPIFLPGLPSEIDTGSLTSIPKPPTFTLALSPISTTTQPLPLDKIHRLSHPTVFATKVFNKTILSQPDADKKILELTLSLDSKALDKVYFKPGDCISLLPQNSDNELEALFHHLKVAEAASQLVTLTNNGLPLSSHLSALATAPISLYQLLKYKLEIMNPLKKPLLQLLATSTTNQAKRAELLYLCSKQGKDLFQTLRSQYPTLLDLLIHFEAYPKVDNLVEVLNPLLPRTYSLTNSPTSLESKHKEKLLAIIFNVDKYSTEYQQARKGLFTNYINDLDLTDASLELFGFIKPTTDKINFHLPTQSQLPLTLVGTGTGIAPYLSYLEHRSWQRNNFKLSGTISSSITEALHQKFGKIWLIHGLRDSNLEDFKLETILGYLKEGTLDYFMTCCSRNTQISKVFTRADGQVKVSEYKYVQDALKDNFELLKEFMVDGNGRFYLCGAANSMPAQVNDTLTSFFKAECNDDEAQAKDRLKLWGTEGRIKRDLW